MCKSEEYRPDEDHEGGMRNPNPTAVGILYLLERLPSGQPGLILRWSKGLNIERLTEIKLNMAQKYASEVLQVLLIGLMSAIGTKPQVQIQIHEFC